MLFSYQSKSGNITHQSSQRKYFLIAANIILQSNTKLKRAYRILLDKVRKFNVHKMFRRCPVRLLNVLRTSNLPPVLKGILKLMEFQLIMRTSQKLIVISDLAITFI